MQQRDSPSVTGRSQFVHPETMVWPRSGVETMSSARWQENPLLASLLVSVEGLIKGRGCSDGQRDRALSIVRASGRGRNAPPNWGLPTLP